MASQWFDDATGTWRDFPRIRKPASNARGDFPTPMLGKDYAPYDCPITGQTIEGRTEHRENLKRHGCRILEPGESREAMERGPARAEAEISTMVERAVASTVAELDI